MGKAIVKIKDKYFEWSTVVDAPVSYGMTLEELREFIREEYGSRELIELDKRLERVEKYGNSFVPPRTLESLISENRAGTNEEKLSSDEIYHLYCEEK